MGITGSGLKKIDTSIKVIPNSIYFFAVFCSFLSVFSNNLRQQEVGAKLGCNVQTFKFFLLLFVACTEIFSFRVFSKQMFRVATTTVFCVLLRDDLCFAVKMLQFKVYVRFRCRTSHFRLYH